jgi:hypothetical protein
VKNLFTIATALLLVAVTSSASSPQAIQQIDVIDFGIYRADRIGQESAPADPAGVLGHVENANLLEATTTIPALLGVRFGFKFKLIGQTGTNHRLKFVILLPQPGIRHGGTGNSVVRCESFQYLAVGDFAYLGYKFDYPWEIVPGKWTCEIWDDDLRLPSQRFIIAASV